MRKFDRHAKLLKELATFSKLDNPHCQFSTSAAASKRIKRPWPPGGSWEYAIADYKLRKEAGHNFWDVGLPPGTDEAPGLSSRIVEIAPPEKADEDATARTAGEGQQQEDTAAEASSSLESPQADASQTLAEPTSSRPRSREEEEAIDQEMRQFAYTELRARARYEAHVAGKHPEVSVINNAGPDRAGWRNLWRDEETGHALWEFDLTGGRCPLNERNACLSRKSKDTIVELYLNGTSVPDIAEFFRIRQQRVMAIIALANEEAKDGKAGIPMHDHFRLMMEGDYIEHPEGDYVFSGIDPCYEAVGAGEKHVKILPRAPHYENKKDEHGKPIPRDWTAEEEALAAKEEEQLVTEFADKLNHNLGLLGGGLRRRISRNKPKRPKGGYSLLVKDLGAPEEVKKLATQSAEAPKPNCYVALPSGQQRELNEDEKYMQYSQRIRARRRLY